MLKAAVAVAVSTPVEDVPPPASQPVAGAKDKPSPTLFISGLTATILGVAGLGVGIAFSARYSKHLNDVNEIIGKANQANRDQDRDLYNSYVAEYEEAKEELEEEIHPKDRAGIIAGFVTGGVLTAAGATLLVLHARKKKREQRTAISPIPGGIAVQF